MDYFLQPIEVFILFIMGLRVWFIFGLDGFEGVRFCGWVVRFRWLVCFLGLVQKDYSCGVGSHLLLLVNFNIIIVYRYRIL
jgi:hypothetical protein